MGRGKVTLKYIQNEKDRKVSFGQRMEGLTKKISKFSSNCGDEACLIVYDGDHRLLTWPEDATVVQTMLKKYEHQKFVTAPKIFDVRDYYDKKKNIVQDEITRVRKNIAKSKYPTWSKFFRVMGEEQIKVLIGTVDAKIKACNQRINILKNMQQSENISARIIDKQKKIDVMHDIPQMQNFSDYVKAINEMMDLTNHDDWINQLFRLDDWIKELHKDYTNGMVNSTNVVDVQQDEISLMLNSAQGNVISLHSSQHDVMHNIPEKQLNNVINVDVSHVSSTHQIDKHATLEDFLMAEPDPELDLQLCGDGLLGLDDLMGELEDCCTKLDVPHVSPTNQLGGILESHNLVAEAAKPKDGDTEVVDFNDNVNWVSQPDMFVKKGLSFLSKN